MRPAHLFTVLERELLGSAKSHTPVMLWGPPGVGKSDIVAGIGAQHGVPVIDIRLSQMEPSDLRGIPFRHESSSGQSSVKWAVPGLLPDRTRHGDRGVLFLDEITSAPPSVSAAAYQLILDRRLGEYRVPDGWAIFAAGNRQGDRGVTYTMPAPLANRFSHYEVEVHLDDWVHWAHANDIDERLIGFLRFRPELLFDFDPALNPVAFPTPRSWAFASRALQKFSDQPELLTQALQACVGPAPGLELRAFIDSLSEMPDVDAILAGEESAVPESLDLQYAVASALVARAIRHQGEDSAPDGMNNTLLYARGFPHREMGVMLVSDLHRVVGEVVFQLPAFASWAEDVADVLL